MATKEPDVSDTSTTAVPLTGQIVVIIGGSSGMGLETARQARAVGADVILTSRDPDRLERAGREVGALRIAEVDLSDPDSLDLFFAGLPTPIDHVFVTGGGPMYVAMADLDFAAALRVIDEHLLGALRLARASANRVSPGGSLTFVTGTDARRPNVGSSVAAILAVALPAIAANIAVELAPIRANVVAAGYVDVDGGQQLLP